MRHSRFVVPVVLAVVASGVVPFATAADATSGSAAPAPQTVTRLAPVTGLETAPSAKGERLHWSDPAPGYTSIVVRRAPGSVAPASPTSGLAIGTLPPGATDLVDASVQPKSVYSYAVFATYSGGRHAAPAAHEAQSSAASPTPSQAGTGTLTGEVTDASGNPLRGVEVDLAPVQPVFENQGSGISFSFFYVPVIAHTAADGTYTLKGVTTASYTLCFVASTHVVTGGASTNLGYADQCPRDAVEGHAGAATPLGTAVLAANNGGVVSGFVSDASTKEPLAGVQVEPETQFGQGFLQTNANGTFRIGLAAGTYVFCFDASFATGGSSSTGYLAQCDDSHPVVVTAGQVSKLNVEMSAGAAVTGVVRSSGDGSPIAGVDVEVASKISYAQTTTAADGTYTLVGLSPGRSKVCVDGFFSAPSGPGGLGWGTACVSANPKVGQTVAAPDVSVDPAGGISGRVTTVDGHPLAGATVTAQGRQYGIEVQTAGNGTYSAKGVPAGTYEVCFNAPSYPFQCYRNADPNDPNSKVKQVKVVSGVVSAGVDALLVGKDPGTVTVTVHDAHGSPLVGADAVLVQSCTNLNDECSPVPVFAKPRNNLAGSELSGADGTATFTGIAAGSYAACAFGRYATGGTSTTSYQDACSDSTYSTVVTTGGTVSVSVTLNDGAAVSGTVTDHKGHPLAGVGVSAGTEGPNLGGPDGPLVTGQDGAFLIDGLASGTTGVCFDASLAVGPSPTGYASDCYHNTQGRPTPITVTSGVVTTGIDEQLKAAGLITGTVTDTDNQPLGSVQVTVDGPNFGFGVQTDPDGTYRVAGLIPGDYQVCFQGEGVPDAPPTGYVDQCWDNVSLGGQPTTVTVRAGQIVSGIDAALQIGAEITGQLTEGGQPLPNGFVALLQRADHGVEGQGWGVDPDGTFDLTGLAAGTYFLCGIDQASSVGACYGGVAWNGRTIPSGATKINIATAQSLTINLDIGSA